jgi:hypothetical protein
MEGVTVGETTTNLAVAISSVRKALAGRVNAATGKPIAAFAEFCKTKDIPETLSALDAHLRNVRSIPRERAGLIPSDHIIAVLTEGVLLMAMLEGLSTLFRQRHHLPRTVLTVTTRCRSDQ